MPTRGLVAPARLWPSSRVTPHADSPRSFRTDGHGQHTLGAGGPREGRGPANRVTRQELVGGIVASARDRDRGQRLRRRAGRRVYSAGEYARERRRWHPGCEAPQSDSIRCSRTDHRHHLLSGDPTRDARQAMGDASATRAGIARAKDGLVDIACGPAAVVRSTCATRPGHQDGIERRSRAVDHEQANDEVRRTLRWVRGQNRRRGGFFFVTVRRRLVSPNAPSCQRRQRRNLDNFQGARVVQSESARRLLTQPGPRFACSLLSCAPARPRPRLGATPTSTRTNRFGRQSRRFTRNRECCFGV